MLKLKSGSRFFEFIRAQKSSLVIATVAICGAALLLIGAPKTQAGDSSSQTLEDRVASLCSSVAGVGECEVMITYSDGDEVYAVAVLCDGAESVSVRREITALASSLFGIGTNRISVLKLSK